ncbi:MAG: hypothetical protein ACOCRK_08130 [bacterium]
MATWEERYNNYSEFELNYDEVKIKENSELYNENTNLGIHDDGKKHDGTGSERRCIGYGLEKGR